jgi:hypothetical protein
MTVRVRVVAEKPVRLRLVVYDATDPQLIFTNRYKTVKGHQDFFIRLPVSPTAIIIWLYNESTGDVPREKETSFKIEEVEKLELEKRLDVADIKNPVIRDWVTFCNDFCTQVHRLRANATYSPYNDKFFIELVPEIKGKDGAVLNTPARISMSTGKIQVAKEKFSAMTFPMRVAILDHEFSHYFLNSKVDDELEADLNGLLLYLSLGFPRIEAYEAFLGTFQGMPTQQNQQRAQMIDKFIKDFESTNKIMIQS